jgi:hypothetical protein
MTLVTGSRRMTAVEWKKSMGKAASCPGKTIQGMTLNTIFRISALDVVWVNGCLIVGLVTIVAFHAPGLKIQQGRRGMALITIGSIMRPDKGKPASLVNLVDIGYNPRFRSMTPAAIGPDSLVMHVGMTIDAGCFSF